MPPTFGRIDPFLGVIYAGQKPERICGYPVCPRQDTGYKGSKLKMCARCKHVRYCSKECQKEDWDEHKHGCKEYQPIADHEGWMEEYQAIFAWAAAEALRVHTSDDILHNALKITATYADSVPASLGKIPSPFFIIHAKVVSLDSDPMIGMAARPQDREKSRNIRANGGAGRAFFVFCFIDDPFRTDLSKAQSIMRPWWVDLTEPLIPNYKHTTGWASLLKGLVNGKISVADLSRGFLKSPMAIEDVDAEQTADEEDSLVDGLKHITMS